MPQKLIRLTCESNDGIFNGLFDQDIHIKQDSDIALQSLTLERLSKSFGVNTSNNTIVFGSKNYPTARTTARLATKLYEEDDRAQLMDDIEFTCNSTQNMMTSASKMNIQWEAYIDEDNDKAVIGARPSPFFPLYCFNPLTGASLLNTYSAIAAPVQNGKPNAVEPFMTSAGFGRLTESVTGTLNECYMFNELSFIKSTGSFRVKLDQMTPGQTSNRPAFTIGLVDVEGLAKLKNATIVMSDLVYAIQVDAPSAAIDTTTGGYSYIKEKGAVATTETLPFVKIENSTDPTADVNDVFEIVIRDGVLQGFIHQETAGKIELPASGNTFGSLYPVVFAHLGQSVGPVVSNTINMIQCSQDPFQLDTRQGVSPDWLDYIEDNQQLNPVTTTLPTVIKYDGVQTALDFDPNFEVATLPIATYLGFTDTELTRLDVDEDQWKSNGSILTIPSITRNVNPNTGAAYDRKQGFVLTGVNVFAGAVDADSYLIDTQTFMLDSYDSYGLSQSERDANSGGSRRNLLACIPAEETVIVNSANARIIYEPNTLDYISIKNRSDTITRQIRMRLLNSRYEPVTTAGLAAMTILIREPYTN